MQIYTKRFFKCDCAEPEEFQVEHLLSDKNRAGVPSRAGPWYCHECGQGYNISYMENQIVEIKKTVRKIRDVAVLLRLDHDPAKDGPIHVVVHGMEFADDGINFEKGHKYFYEEHTCPSSILRDVEDVWFGEDKDAHGVFTIIAAAAKPIPCGRQAQSEQHDELFERHAAIAFMNKG